MGGLMVPDCVRLEARSRAGQRVPFGCWPSHTGLLSKTAWRRDRIGEGVDGVGGQGAGGREER